MRFNIESVQLDTEMVEDENAPFLNIHPKYIDILKAKGFDLKYETEEDISIEVESLERLMELLKVLNRECVISSKDIRSPHVKNLYPRILIYDGYIE